MSRCLWTAVSGTVAGSIAGCQSQVKIIGSPKSCEIKSEIGRCRACFAAADGMFLGYGSTSSKNQSPQSPIFKPCLRAPAKIDKPLAMKDVQFQIIGRNKPASRS